MAPIYPGSERSTKPRLLFLAVALALYAAAGGTARCDEPRESPLDRAVRDLDQPAPKTESPDDHGHRHGPALEPRPADTDQADAVGSFLDSWELFRNSYLAGWLIGLLLALVGVIVVARDQVFIGAAVSQASTLGIALALCASSVFPLHHASSLLSHSASWICCDSFQVFMAVAFSMLAALVTSQANRTTRESHEAVTGWVFLISSSLSVLVLAHSPFGLEEIRRIHSSSIIGATATDAAVFGVLLAITVLFIAVGRQRLLLFVMDPPMAAAVGMNVGCWAVCESLWLGLVVGLSIRVSGMLFTFGGLVLPALVAKNACREVRTMFVLSPVVALLTNTVGFVLANRYDCPPAQMNVALLGFLLAAVWLLRHPWLARLFNLGRGRG